MRAAARLSVSGWSLRRKLVMSIMLLFVLSTVATGVLTVTALNRSLTMSLDERVRQMATGPQPVPRPASGYVPDARFVQQGLFAAVDEDTGLWQGRASSRSNELIPLSTTQLKTLTEAQPGSTPITVDLGGDLGGYRVVGVAGRDGGVVFRGLPITQNRETITRLSLLVAGFGAGALVLVGLSASFLVRRNLAPLERVASIAGNVSHLPLSSGEVALPERVPPSDTDPRTEVGQVGAALNALLDNVDSSLQARHRSETKLRQFVADASHELRTPLASIRGYAELSRRETEPVPAGVQHALARIDSESARMARLVEDLLLLARLDAGRPLAMEPVDLTILLVDAVSDAHAAGRDHDWQLDLPPESVETVGDPARLTQVIVNLLANARVHTPPGTRVTAGVRDHDDTGPTSDGGWAGGPAAVLTITDDGPGIPTELLPRIFSRFTRGDEARARHTNSGQRPGTSTGLGLSIVSAVVAAHHGHVAVTTKPGETTFTVYLPRQRGSDAADASAGDSADTGFA